MEMLFIAPLQFLCVSVLHHFRQHFNLLILCAETFATLSFGKYEMLYKSLKCTYSNFGVGKPHKSDLSKMSQ